MSNKFKSTARGERISDKNKFTLTERKPNLLNAQMKEGMSKTNYIHSAMRGEIKID